MNLRKRKNWHDATVLAVLWVDWAPIRVAPQIKLKCRFAHNRCWKLFSIAYRKNKRCKRKVYILSFSSSNFSYFNWSSLLATAAAFIPFLFTLQLRYWGHRLSLIFRSFWFRWKLLVQTTAAGMMKISEKFTFIKPPYRQWLRRVFPAILVVAILVTIIGKAEKPGCFVEKLVVIHGVSNMFDPIYTVPTWQVYTEESR